MKMIKKLLWIILDMILFVLVFSVSFRAGVLIPVEKYNKPLETDWDESSGEIFKDIQYGEEEGELYDLYIPSNLAKEDKQSLILFIHGGGFTSGDKGDEEKWCKFFATKGYITASISYTLQTAETNSNINLMNSEILACVTSMKEECQKKGYEISGMALSGQSAGGCLAMLYAYKNIEESPIPVKFVFQQTGPASFKPELWGSTSTSDQAAFVSIMTGKTVSEEMIKDGSYMELVDEISPASCVDENTVPTLCAYGPKDKIVPVDIKYTLFDQFDTYDTTYEFIEFSNSGHALLKDPNKQKEFVNRALEYCDLFFE